ncbi:hypothetical protein M3148_11460 [Georgenia satyanarayanai]|uniref:COG1470 family protein n=1 Tax=Georgenia satyanarayanai TaxID=860221 RepID=UPI00204127DE|nr:hypothetical protein [Georgenia satyanarayanai]MCM3661601.1 hypothetical protein [Georgenia satyanarayanai]
MTTTARLERPTVQLTAGTVEQVPLQIRNDGEIVEGYRIEVLGVPGAWASVEPAEITGLFPGAETTATISFAPPRSASVPAGQLSFGVRVVPTEHPEQTVVPEGMVEVLPFLETTAELVPRTSRGRRGATHHVAVDNRGNVPVTVRLDAPDQDALRVEARPPALTVPPGEAAFADLRVAPRSRIWRGASVTHPFTLTVHTEETTPVTLEGTHLQEAVLPPWFLKALLALLALLLLLAALWFLVLRPTIESTARRAVEEEVAQANEAAQEAAVAAQQAGEEAGQASNAAQAAQGAATEAGSAAVEANELVGSPTLDDLVVPVGDRFQVNTAPGATQSPEPFVVPAEGTVRLTDFVLSNPQGDFGRVEVTLDGRTLLDLALENFRSVDYHFQEPIVAGEGAELTMTVRCDEVGVPPAQDPPPTNCDTSVLYGGTLLQPVED